MNVSTYFDIRELVYPELYQQYGDSCIWFLDIRMINVLDFMRTELGVPCTVNNWHTGGQYKESGLRSFNTTTGGKLSQHKFGRGFDPKFKGLTPAQVFDFIEKEWAQLSRLGMTTVEDIAYTPTWNHGDCRYWGDNKLHIVKP